MKNIKICNREIGNRHPCYIVAEIGAMYEDLEGMKKLIKQSKEAGADAVKIQTYHAETISLPGSVFEFEDGSTMSQYDFFKQYEISPSDHIELFNFAQKLGITFFSTPSDYEDVNFLNSLGVPAFKVGSDDVTNYPFLSYIAGMGKPVILSTGMSTMPEIEGAVNAIVCTGNNQLILLHCTVAYPPSPEYANLNIITTLEQAFDYPIGYSDHVTGIFPSVLAASMGACVIEKHVTLDRALKRPDYQVSVEPQELRELVNQIRQTRILQGSTVKKVYPPEKKWRKNARKSLVATKNLFIGDTLKREDFKIMRPGTGISPIQMDSIIGRTLRKNISENHIIPRDAI